MEAMNAICKRSTDAQKALLACVLLLLSLLPAATRAQASKTGTQEPTPTGVKARVTTLKTVMDQLHKELGVNFVYDAALPVDQPYKGPALRGLPLPKALKTLFDGTGIDYRQNGRYVMLFAAAPSSPRPANRKYTLSGHVRDSIGETLINATVYDLTTGQGTMTNEHGYYSLTLPEGPHQLRIAYVGYAEEVRNVGLYRHQQQDFTLNQGKQLGEVVVMGDLNSPTTGTQMGKTSLSQQDIKTEYALLSSPDVVKTLQRLSGVQEGVELASGLYVHGGNNDENLFLLDGSPLYQINHSLGLFSSFNVDMVKNVDFYKSGFPARYGGRLSSVVDVRTLDGNMQQWHGSYRIGLLDGSLNFDGPLQRGKTSLNVGLRRSWLDLCTRPAFAIANRKSDKEKLQFNYAFHDLNAKLTHVFNPGSRISLSLYSGIDALGTKDDWRDIDNGWMYARNVLENRFTWGNFNAALDWQLQLSPQLMATFTAVYTHNRAHLHTTEDDRSFDHSGKASIINYDDHSYRSTIYDAGYRTEFDYRPSPLHHIRFGHDYTHHDFRPQTNNRLILWDNDTHADTLKNNSRNRHQAHELTLYAEDQLTLTERWSLNGGLNLSLFAIEGKTFANADPRLALKYQLASNAALKASFTQMTQFVHKITNAFLELPTDYWVPTTARLKPMHSQQWAAGVYWQPRRQLTLSLEGYYKLTRHLLQYSSWAGLEPPAAKWDTQVMDGRGRFYGIELDAQYHTHRLQADAAYTLSWNKRRFDDFFPHWYYDKFDNRHKLNLSLRYHLSQKTQMYAAWTYHTGNHMTFPTQYMAMPNLPDGTPANGDTPTRFVYEQPNNITLPAYHRLDLGFNFHHTTKHGHERIWNLSVYNAYCHLNTLWTDIDYSPVNGNKVDLSGHKAFSVKPRGYIPIIPSFSYTIKF